MSPLDDTEGEERRARGQRRDPAWRRRRTSRKSDLERLFVALYPPESVSRELVYAVGDLPLPPHRIVPTDQVHLTLAFLGNRRRSELESIAESVERAAAGQRAFELTLEHWRYLPEDSPARVLVAETDAPSGLLELQRRLSSRLLGQQGSGRAFRPHLTVARLKNAREPLDMAPLPALVPSSFRVERIELLRSVLRPEGAEHVGLKRVDLLGGPGEALD